MEKGKSVNNLKKQEVRFYQKLDFINKNSLELLRKFAYLIQSEFHTLNTNFNYLIKEEEDKSNKTIKQGQATFKLNNGYWIECTPFTTNLSESWNCFMYRTIEGNHEEVIFTFTFMDNNLEDIATTIKVFCAGSPAWKLKK